MLIKYLEFKSTLLMKNIRRIKRRQKISHGKDKQQYRNQFTEDLRFRNTNPSTHLTQVLRKGISTFRSIVGTSSNDYKKM